METINEDGTYSDDFIADIERQNIVDDFVHKTVVRGSWHLLPDLLRQVENLLGDVEDARPYLKHSLRSSNGFRVIRTDTGVPNLVTKDHA